jgi:hypothetical protein
VFAVGLVTARSPPWPSTPHHHYPDTTSTKSAAAFVASRPSILQPSADDAYLQQATIAAGATRYVPYERMYKGLRVLGGDFVVVTDRPARRSTRQWRKPGRSATCP